MAAWGVIAGGYGLVLAAAALALPIARRPITAVAALAYALFAFGAGTLVSWFWIQLLVPGALLLAGYWISGFFFRAPQPWLERFLLDTDTRVFRALDVDVVLRRAPLWVLELLEASYTADYVVVGGGAIISAFAGLEAISSYWSLVLAAELASYAALPWLRSRPPRILEGHGVIAERAPVLRRLNVTILDRASVQANTLPSGHVAGAVAAALAVWPINATAGAGLMVMAILIAIAAAVCRYHYVVDCAAGAGVAVLAWAIVG